MALSIKCKDDVFTSISTYARDPENGISLADVTNAQILYENAKYYYQTGEYTGALVSYSCTSVLLYSLLKRLQPATLLHEATGGVPVDEERRKIKKNIEDILTCCLNAIKILNDKVRSMSSGGNKDDDEKVKNWDKICQKIKPLVFKDGSPDCLFFNGVAGLASQKQLITSSMIWPLVYKNLYPKISKGLLIYGPPGTGKTLLVKAAVNELQLKNDKVGVLFFAPSPGDMKGKFVGETEKKIEEIFTCASNAACESELNCNNDKKYISVVFIDEIDGIAGDRDMDQTGLVANSVNTLLQMMDGIKSKPNVVVIGATNYPWKLDGAVLRRFDSQIMIDIGDESEIKELMTMEMNKIITIPEDNDFNYCKAENNDKVLTNKTKDEDKPSASCKFECKYVDVQKNIHNRLSYKIDYFNDETKRAGYIALLAKNKYTNSDITRLIKAARVETGRMAIESNIFYSAQLLKENSAKYISCLTPWKNQTELLIAAVKYVQDQKKGSIIKLNNPNYSKIEFDGDVYYNSKCLLLKNEDLMNSNLGANDIYIKVCGVDGVNDLTIDMYRTNVLGMVVTVDPTVKQDGDNKAVRIPIDIIMSYEIVFEKVSKINSTAFKTTYYIPEQLIKLIDKPFRNLSSNLTELFNNRESLYIDVKKRFDSVIVTQAERPAGDNEKNVTYFENVKFDKDKRVLKLPPCLSNPYFVTKLLDNAKIIKTILATNNDYTFYKSLLNDKIQKLGVGGVIPDNNYLECLDGYKDIKVVAFLDDDLTGMSTFTLERKITLNKETFLIDNESIYILYNKIKDILIPHPSRGGGKKKRNEKRKKERQEREERQDEQELQELQERQDEQDRQDEQKLMEEEDEQDRLELMEEVDREEEEEEDREEEEEEDREEEEEQIQTSTFIKFPKELFKLLFYSDYGSDMLTKISNVTGIEEKIRGLGNKDYTKNEQALMQLFINDIEANNKFLNSRSHTQNDVKTVYDKYKTNLEKYINENDTLIKVYKLAYQRILDSYIYVVNSGKAIVANGDNITNTVFVSDPKKFANFCQSIEATTNNPVLHTKQCFVATKIDLNYLATMNKSVFFKTEAYVRSWGRETKKTAEQKMHDELQKLKERDAMLPLLFSKIKAIGFIYTAKIQSDPRGSGQIKWSFMNSYALTDVRLNDGSRDKLMAFISTDRDVRTKIGANAGVVLAGAAIGNLAINNAALIAAHANVQIPLAVTAVNAPWTLSGLVGGLFTATAGAIIGTVLIVPALTANVYEKLLAGKLAPNRIINDSVLTLIFNTLSIKKYIEYDDGTDTNDIFAKIIKNETSRFLKHVVNYLVFSEGRVLIKPADNNKTTVITKDDSERPDIDNSQLINLNIPWSALEKAMKEVQSTYQESTGKDLRDYKNNRDEFLVKYKAKEKGKK